MIWSDYSLKNPFGTLGKKDSGEAAEGGSMLKIVTTKGDSLGAKQCWDLNEIMEIELLEKEHDKIFISWV